MQVVEAEDTEPLKDSEESILTLVTLSLLSCRSCAKEFYPARIELNRGAHVTQNA